MGVIVLLIAALSLHAAESRPFSHKRHAPLRLKCNSCHASVETRERAGFPAFQQCKVCHTAMPERKIPSARIYRNKDFVVFSHGSHVLAKVECNSCHGDVYRQDALSVFRPTTMAACVECHLEKKATMVCNTCHELGQ